MSASRASDPGATDLPQLSEGEARARLTRDGPNLVAHEAPHTLLRAVWGVVSEPMLVLLLAACGLTFALGSAQDALTLLVFVVAVMGLTLYQDRRSEHALARLRDLTAPTAQVVRDGSLQTLPSRAIVSGDLVLLAEGGRVPADCVVLRSTNLALDESLLTGESGLIHKFPAADVEAPLVAPGRDASSSVYAGTLVVAGSAYASVRATGSRSALGSLGRELATIQRRPSALAREVRRWVVRIAWFGGALCLSLMLGYAWLEGDFLRGVLSAITLAMAILPEELPVVLAVFTTLGAFRLAKHGVLSRRPEAIEALGAASVVCVDKTGTITENRMRVAALQKPGGAAFELPPSASREPGGPLSLPEEVHEVLEFALLASAEAAVDPMERAIAQLSRRSLSGTEHLHADYAREQEYPLTSELFSVSHLFLARGAHDHVVAAKGAPEAIFDLCHLSPEATAARMVEVSRLAARGYRVLAVARARYLKEQHPPEQHDFEFALVGFVGFEDPVRPSVPSAVRAFREAGARVVMITGDHAETARAIAERAELDLSAGVLTGAELSSMSEGALTEAVRRVNVFARTTPEHKLRLVEALQQSGEIVAMTGDGVNDAPALKKADVGIALGVRGTDVAREAASLVLANEDFGAIASGMRIGRRMVENLRKATLFILAVHVPIAGLSLVPVFVGLPVLLLPVHVAFLQLIIDPACALVFEAESEEPVRVRAPVRVQLFERPLLVRGLLQGAVLFGAVMSLYAVAYGRGIAEGEARAMTFLALVVGNVGLINVQRSSTRGALASMRASPNRWANLLSLGAIVALCCVLFIPFLRALFHFALPTMERSLAAVLVGLGAVLWYDLIKRMRARHGTRERSAL